MGIWPYNVIRDFSCRDDKFSFTSGRRGPFGVGTHQFQLTPPVLSKLTSAITVITGAQFGPKTSSQQSPEPQEPTSSPQDQYSVSSAQVSVSNGSYGSHVPSPKAHQDSTYDRLVHSACSSPDLKASRPMQYQSPPPFKKQMSSPGPVRQIKRPRHHYEEIDSPGAVGGAIGSPLSSISVASAPLTTPSVPCTATMSTSNISADSCSEEGTLSTDTGSAIYENVPALVNEGTHTLECGRKSISGSIQPHTSGHCHFNCKVHYDLTSCTCGHDHCDIMACKQDLPSQSEEVYDRPAASLYSVPTHTSDGKLLTLNARRGCAQIPKLALPQKTCADTLYGNTESIQDCFLLADDQDGGDIYEEIDSALGCLRQSVTQAWSGSPDAPCRPSMVAQQLATEEGYELVTSRGNFVSHNAGDKGGSSDHPLALGRYKKAHTPLYINQEKVSDSSTEESDSEGYVVVRSPKSPPTRCGLSERRENQELSVKSECLLSRSHMTTGRVCTDVGLLECIPVSECAAF